MMKDIYLVNPSIEHEEAYKEMMSEWLETKEHIHPGTIRRSGIDYTDLLEMLVKYKKYETCPSQFVPSETFFLVNGSNKILGAISIRHYLREPLLNVSGHIGYGIRPTERRKGYAKRMLKLALDKCRSMGMDRVMITCNKDNVGSAQTIIANCGIFEKELVEADGNIVQRYWIEL